MHMLSYFTVQDWMLFFVLHYAETSEVVVSVFVCSEERTAEQEAER